MDRETMQVALRSLAGPRIHVTDGHGSVRDAPGLYAIHGAPDAWMQLGLGAPPDDRPLYVGKSERSLNSRDVRTHFATGKTGSSTVRRSLAGLLAVDLDLRGRPRNPARPERFANFGLEPAGDARLTEWMLEHLRLSVWPSPAGVSLDPIETAVVTALVPPLNLDKVVTPWRALVRSGRRRLADQARCWDPSVVTVGSEAPDRRQVSAASSGRALGLDAAGKHGWVGVLVDDSGFVAARIGCLSEIVAWAEPVDTIGIDIPIGHVPAGVRQADIEARQFVGPRGSSVFAAPPAQVLAAGSCDEANEILSAAGMLKLSRQAWALVPKIVEAAAVAAMDDRVFEVHPEVSFRELAESPLPWSKKSWNGLLLRRELLADRGIVVPDSIPEVAGAGADDVLDAAVVAWSARRIARGIARTLPDPPEMSTEGRVAIWR